jgi:hypothetical protein
MSTGFRTSFEDEPRMSQNMADMATEKVAMPTRPRSETFAEADPVKYEQMSQMPFRINGELIHLLERHAAEGATQSAAMAGGFQEQVRALGQPGQTAAPMILADFVTIQVEGLCSSLARLAASRGQSYVRLSTGRKFEPAVGEELLTCLELDRRRAGPSLERLHKELQQFAAAMPRHRDWGTLLADASGITLAVDAKGAAAVPQIDKLPPELWTVLS